MRKLAGCLVSLLLLAMACHVDISTKVEVEGGNPPAFVLSGFSNLTRAQIFEPGYKGSVLDASHVLWGVTSESSEGSPIKELGPITYGVVPKGFKQSIPENEVAPVALSEGNRYRFYFHCTTARPAEGYFEIRNGKAVILEKVT